MKKKRKNLMLLLCLQYVCMEWGRDLAFVGVFEGAQATRNWQICTLVPVPNVTPTRIISSATSSSHKEIAHIHAGSPCSVIARPQLSCSFCASQTFASWSASGCREEKKKKVYEKRKYMLRPSQENQLSTQQMCVQHIQLNEM